MTFLFLLYMQRTGKRRMEVAIPQLHKMGESFVPVSWQPSDAKESIKANFGRIRYQVRKSVLLFPPFFFARGFALQQSGN